MMDQGLPQGFEALVPYQPYWGVRTTQERRDRREAASMEDITAFYQVMLQHAPAAMKHLEAYTVQTMPEPEARLYELVLALAHVSMATELHGQPRAPFAPYPHDVKLVHGLVDFG